MLKKIAIFFASLAVTTMVALAYITARYIDQEEILRAQNEMQDLRQEKVELESKIATLNSQQEELNKVNQRYLQEIESNKQTIAKLEQERSDNQIQVRALKTENQLEEKFAQTYPQVVGAKNFGITQINVSDTEQSINLPYFVIPAWFVETFIIEHNSMKNYQSQINEYQRNEKAYGTVLELKDQVLRLEAQKTIAYQDGYTKAYIKYESLNQDYIDLLKKPPTVEFKAPSLWTSVGGLVVGLAVGAGL